jgi:hypothetical protein
MEIESPKTPQISIESYVSPMKSDKLTNEFIMKSSLEINRRGFEMSEK